MAIPNPNPNIVDGYPCDNKTYSSNKIEALIQVATELPVIHDGDAGKVLTVNADSDAYELDTVPNELPTPEVGDEGKVLAVDNELGYELAAPVDPSVLIDDTAAATTTTYSSDKINTLLSDKANSADLATVATSGSYADLINKPISKETGVGFGAKVTAADSIVKVYSIGKVCQIYAYIALANDITDGDTILTGLPERAGARSANTIPVHVGNSYFNTDSVVKGSFVDASGNLCIATSTTIESSNYIIINGWYELS